MAGGSGSVRSAAILFVLAPVCAEYVAAYDSSTGQALELAAGLLILAPLYGGPALLIRETARRHGLGWPGIVLLATAFGIVQAGIVDQSLFSASYRGIPTWDGWRQSSYIAPLGVSADMALTFIGGHVIYSIGAPIALVEALSPRPAAAWLGRRGLFVVGLLYIAASALVLRDHLATETSHASTSQIAGAAVVAVVLIAAAMRKRPARPLESHRAATPVTVFVASLAGATAATLAADAWLAAVAGAAILGVAAWSITEASRAVDWSRRHVAALASGALVSRALLAFTYDPLVGEVTASAKYVHNAAMLGLVALVSLLAWRQPAITSASPGLHRR